MADDDPHVFIARRERDRAALEPVVEAHRGVDLGVATVVFNFFCEHVRDVEGLVAFLFAVAVEQVPREGLEERVLRTHFFMEEH